MDFLEALRLNTKLSSEFSVKNLPSTRVSIAGQLESAARILRENEDGARDDSVAWRVADAGLRLRRLIEADSDWEDVGGVHSPTGLGAILSPLPIEKKKKSSR